MPYRDPWNTIGSTARVAWVVVATAFGLFLLLLLLLSPLVPAELKGQLTRDPPTCGDTVAVVGEGWSAYHECPSGSRAYVTPLGDRAVVVTCACGAAR